jgi:predicted Ser/Thr protein kinase
MPILEKIGKYEVLERIGGGGMGTVFKARDSVLNRIVALKVISGGDEVTDELRARFFREAQACARLTHPNIITIYDLGEGDGRLFIVMEYLDGRELKQLIAQQASITIEDKLSIMRQVCDGLHYAHLQGIIHRDIKPGNILIRPDGQVKILDFGVARIADTEQGLTRTGLIMGTLRYVAPEQIRGLADARSDIFSVGAVFYELLSGQAPFSGKSAPEILDQIRTQEPRPLQQIDPSLPAELAELVAHALRKDPAERFTDLLQVRRVVEGVERKLRDEGHLLRSRVEQQRNRLIELRQDLLSQTGECSVDAPGPIEDEQETAALRALELRLSGEIEELEAKVRRAVESAPVVERAFDALGAGRFEEAADEFGVVLSAAPDHARAREGMELARAGSEREHRRQLATRLLEDARAALAEGSFAFCLEVLKQVEEIPAPDELSVLIRSLRVRAESRIAVEETRRAQLPIDRQRGLTERGRDPGHSGPATTKDPGTSSGTIKTGAEETRTVRHERPEPATDVPVFEDRPESTNPHNRVSHDGAITPLELEDARRGPGDEIADGRWSWQRWARGLAVVAGGLVVIGAVAFIGSRWGTSSHSSVTDRGSPAVARDAGTGGGADDKAGSRPSEQLGAGKETTSAVTERSPAFPPAPAAGTPDGAATAPRQRQEVHEPQPSQPAQTDEPARDSDAKPSLPPRSVPSSRLTDSPGDTPRPSPSATGAKMRRDVEQAKSRLNGVKRGAEQTAAAFYAPRSWAVARAKEDDAIQAIERSDYAAAVGLLDEARAAYQASLEESRREAEKETRLGPLKADVAESRASAMARRDEALRVGADRLARDTFESAQARHQEADDLARSQNLASAAHAYRDASDRYSAAIRQAQVK